MNSFLAITYSFMLAYCPYDQMVADTQWELYNDVTHVQFELGVDLQNKIRFYAGEETLQTMDGSITNWFSYTQNYWGGAEYREDICDKLTVFIGASHSCRHPLSVWGNQPSNFNTSRTEIYLKVSGKVEIF